MIKSPNEAVLYSVQNSVAVLTIDFPPVNALAAPMREGMILRLKQAQSDDSVDAIVIVGANNRFIAGADIREFGKEKVGPTLAAIHEELQGSAKPVVAAIDGHALGGGLETALAAHYRVAASRAKVGLPEINLGILPGGGGTQRITRLVGPEVALDLILSGRHISAEEALGFGIIDEATDGDVTEAAIAFARRKLADGGPWPVILERTDKVTGIDAGVFDDVRARNAGKWNGMVAPFEIVNCIEAACTMLPRDGLLFEREAFERCNHAPSRAAQVHLFFAERAAAKVEGAKDVAAQSVSSVGIIGAGTMGGGIAMAIANAGLAVKLLDASQDALAAGLERIEQNYATSLARGSRTQDDVDAALRKIETGVDYNVLADVDLIIEAVFEDMGVKHEVFRKLDKVCKPGAILASNTSALDIDEIASATSRPADVIGLHFFSPANVMKLLEVVRGDQASLETVVAAMAFAKQIGKQPVLAGNCFGFIGNRILHRYGEEADLLLLEGATPWQIDKVLKDFGFPMGIYLMRDMAGLDVSYRVRRNKAATGALDMASVQYNPIADRICENGDHGQKSGCGYYSYEGRSASPRPEVEEMLAAISREKEIERKEIADEEVLWRILAAIVNEGSMIVQEGIAQRPSDIDVAYTHGYGFPKYRGGPMFWAQQQGLDKVLAKVMEYQTRYPQRWEPSQLLVDRAAAGGGWDE